MKKLIMFAAFFSFLAVSSVNAQCSKSVSGTKTSTTEKKACTKSVAGKTCTKAAAAKLASLNENVEANTCSTTGKTVYMQKSVCASSGKVSMKEVKYCSETKQFVNVSPSANRAANPEAVKASAAPAKKTCTKSATSVKTSAAPAKKTCTKSATAVKTSASAAPAKKACCASKTGSTAKAACSKKSPTTTTTSTKKAVKAKKVSIQDDSTQR